MVGIRQKLMLGFGVLVAVTIVIGVLTVVQIERLGGAIDVILRENYRSVVACQNMKESLERIDSGILFTLAGMDKEGQELIGENTGRFRAALESELGNITIPGESEKAQRVKASYEQYSLALPAATDTSRSFDERLDTYRFTLLPLFQEMKGTAQEILEMNQANMSEANDAARDQAAAAHRRTLAAMLGSVLIAILWSVWVRRWILEPIHKLIGATDDVRNGNLDLVLDTRSRDEIGVLSASFNEMTSALRRARTSDRLDLMRTRRATEEVFKALPEAVTVFDLRGCVEVSTDTAERYFGLKPGVFARDLGYDWLPRLIQTALDENKVVGSDASDDCFQRFIDNREHFFQPMAVPIREGPKAPQPTGAALILKDVTQAHERQELRQGVVSTVSHQLRTPLTSLRMAVHLLLDGRLGSLNEKQTELLIGAREDSERLVEIIDDLLDLNRIESRGKHIALQACSPHSLAQDGIEPFLVEARDKGIGLTNTVHSDLPSVLADSARIRHVFANLLSNALRYTHPGGTVTVGAFMEPAFVRFTVEDKGAGIPSEYINRLFEPFFRVPGQDEKTGVGLGLAIVKEIVRAHGGDVGADSAEGRGTGIWFTLTRADAEGSNVSGSGHASRKD